MFTQAIVRTPGPDAGSGLTTSTLGKPDHPALLRQHAAYVQTLRDLGLTITHLDALDGHPDAYFVEDAALMFPELAVVTRPGAPERLAEAEALSATVARFRPMVQLSAPATLDGGDVLAMGKRVFVGLSERTNKSGAEELAEILRPHGYSVTPVRVPAGLHLKSSVTWAGADVVVLTEALSEDFLGYEQLVVPADEAYAANVLWVNGTLLMPRGFPRTEAMLARLGLPLRVLEQSEVQKMDGALTCMSLRF
ncbi:MAG: arginine deiminase family protein [Archangium sp.]|nr:arginine deiminase family protein [Archangium sp.]